MVTGYRIETEWMGRLVVTLADVWPESPRAMIVGLNPAPRSVEAGHYYQGASGRRQLRRLAKADLFPLPDDDRFETPALGAGIGFTDIVKRPTSREGDVGRAEIAHGRDILVRELTARSIPLVVCAFRHPVEALLGRPGPSGMQDERTDWGGLVFRMPGPFAAADEVSRVMAELTAWVNAETGR